LYGLIKKKGFRWEYIFYKIHKLYREKKIKQRDLAVTRKWNRLSVYLSGSINFLWHISKQNKICTQKPIWMHFQWFAREWKWFRACFLSYLLFKGTPKCSQSKTNNVGIQILHSILDIPVIILDNWWINW